MERRVNQTVIYQGLFLIALAMFANQKNMIKAMLQNPPHANDTAENEAKPRPLFQLYAALKESSFFSHPIDGVSLELKSNRVLISVDNDELYANDEVQLADTWTSFFAELTVFLQSKLKNGSFEVRVVGYPDAGNALNRESALGTAVARANGIIQNMKHPFAQNPQVKLEASAGVEPQHGHRLDVEIEFLGD